MKIFFGKNNVAKLHFSKIGFLGLLFLLCACQSTAVTNEGAQQQNDTKISKWSEVWTVVLEADYSEWRYTLQAPFGTFWFPLDKGVFYNKRLARASSVNMSWHYPSGTPEYVWLRSFLPYDMPFGSEEAKKYTPKDELILSTKLRLSNKLAEESAKITALSNFEDYLKSGDIKDKGLVWNGRARKYEGFDKLYYKLLDRKEGEAYIIYCHSKKVYYCTLEDIAIDDNLVAEDIFVPARDLENWRKYQNKMLEWIKKTIIRKEKVNETKGEMI